ncbi:MAG: P-loop NTPase fold protein [Candidatus Hinthialibacter antarcticus]|nr:P-loop NTPase fold protein [Candidatus Hinthialibacter antarcticus]
MTNEISLPNDALGHDEFAKSIINMISNLPSGSVISIQGPWGHGKTDTLKRIEKEINSSEHSQILTQTLWINPWQYGKTDLLTPLVIQISELLQDHYCPNV